MQMSKRENADYSFNSRNHVTRDESESLYKDYISEELSLKSDGTIDSEINAFNINLALEVKKRS